MDSASENKFVPFRNIGLSLSGGGYRAAAFGLGTLAYLNRVSFAGHKLLEQVVFLTSTSGGSFPAMSYAAFLYNGEADPLGKTYRLLFEVMNRRELPAMAMEVLEDRDNRYWGKSGRYPLKERNLINAFSIVYQEQLFEGKHFGVFQNKAQVHLKEVCFNAAEMINGRAFRFQSEEQNRCKLLGNYYLKTLSDSQSVANIRLGDVLAASSCFPGGFEPIYYPRDFAKDEHALKQFYSDNFQAPDHDFEADAVPYTGTFPLMDGGITDNQGIESLRLADERRREKPEGNHTPFNLMLICDVANYYSEPYEVPEAGTGIWAWLPVKGIFRSWMIFLALMITNIAGCGYLTCEVMEHTALNPAFISLYFLSSFIPVLVLLFIYSYVYKLYRNEMKEMKSKFGASLFEKGLKVVVRFISVQKLGGVQLMLKNRIKSVMRILYSVMLLQIRRVNYDFLFGNATWKGRIKTINIYKLATANRAVYNRTMKKFEKDLNFSQGLLKEKQVELLKPSKRIEEVAETARTMDTTLWFTEKDKAENKGEKLIACGMFTTCHTLLEHTYTMLNNPALSIHHEELNQLAGELEKDWAAFLSDPMWLTAKLTPAHDYEEHQQMI